MNDYELAEMLINFIKSNTAGLAKTIKKLPQEQSLEVRRKLRPIAVELLYEVIGTPKTFEEILNEMED